MIYIMGYVERKNDEYVIKTKLDNFEENPHIYGINYTLLI